MSKKKDNKIVRHSGRGQSPWDLAIIDAERMIQEAKDQIRNLKAAREGFKSLKDSGHPFPGTSESENRLLGQDGHLGQSR